MKHPATTDLTPAPTDLAEVPGEAPNQDRQRTVPRVSYLVYRVERLLRARLDDAVRGHGVTTTEYVTLSVLHERDGLSCAQLARWAFVTPQAMNLVISALEKRGLVRRRPDPNHGRVRRTSLTKKGLQIVERCDRSMDAIEADMLGTIPPRSVQAVRAGLYDFAHSLEATSASFSRRAGRH